MASITIHAELTRTLQVLENQQELILAMSHCAKCNIQSERMNCHMIEYIGATTRNYSRVEWGTSGPGRLRAWRLLLVRVWISKSCNTAIPSGPSFRPSALRSLYLQMLHAFLNALSTRFIKYRHGKQTTILPFYKTCFACLAFGYHVSSEKHVLKLVSAG